MNPIRLAITLYSGWLQSLGSPGSGLVGIRRDIELLAANRGDVRVSLFPWNADESDVAESLWRDRPLANGNNPKQQHIVAGYSYGCDRAIKFIQQLQERGGCHVRHLFLCDGVRRWDYLPGVAGWFGVGRLIVPSIVEECTYFVQRNPRLSWRWPPFEPAGHEVAAQDRDATTIHGPIVRQAHHSYIDNDSQFRLNVLAAVDRALNHAEESQAEALR